MSRSTERLRGLRAAVCIAAVVATGCRNPFNPSADIELAEFRAEGTSDELTIQKTNLFAANPSYISWPVSASFVIKNKVAATITNINVMYTDENGNPLTSYAAVGGKSFKVHVRLNPMDDRNSVGQYNPNYTEGSGSSITIYLIDPQVMYTFKSLDAAKAPMVMIAVVTFRGDDDNGYDFKLVGTINIKVY